jgi:3-oxoadipate enol-lactonase
MRQFTTTDDVTLVYDDLGSRQGVPVVLCHGLAAAGEQLAEDAAFFATRGYRVLVPNLRGHGKSGKPMPLVAGAFSIARMANDLVEMLDDAAAAPVHWVGNSLGGIVALEMLANHEARFRTLTTFGTAYALHLPRWIGASIPAGYGIMGAGLTATVTALATTRSRAARPVIAKLIRQFDPKVGRLVAGVLADYDLIGNAAAATLPILMLRGGRDRQVNAALGPTLAAMRERPSFTLVELPEGGHCANLDATEMWRAELLKFWDGR